jgi:hypothetical protein
MPKYKYKICICEYKRIASYACGVVVGEGACEAKVLGPNPDPNRSLDQIWMDVPNRYSGFAEPLGTTNCFSYFYNF